MSVKLYNFPGNPRGNACRIVAEMAGVDVDFQWVSMAQVKSELLAIYPLGQIPFIQTADQQVLAETNAILRYFARLSSKRQNLLGKTAYEQGLVNQWLDFISQDIYGYFPDLFYATFGFSQVDDEVLKKYSEAKKNLLVKLNILNQHLALNTFLAGHQVTIADVNLYTVLVFMFNFVFDDNQRKPLTNIVRYYLHVGNCEEVLKYYRKPFLTKTEWIQGKKEDKKAQEPKKKEEKKPEQKKKEEPKKKKEEDEEEEEPVEKKPKDPLDALPPSTFNLFEFKTLYVNAPNKEEALDFLWKNYDANGYSFWYVKYDKYEGEGIKLYLTSNLKDSTLQRLDTFRKHVFGTFGVYGEEGNYEIRGIWLWRGTGIAPQLLELPNYEYHQWIKLDHTNEEHRKLLHDYWTGLENNVSVADGLVARNTGYLK